MYSIEEIFAMLGGRLLDRNTGIGTRCLRSEKHILKVGGILGLEKKIWAQKLGRKRAKRYKI